MYMMRAYMRVMCVTHKYCSFFVICFFYSRGIINLGKFQVQIRSVIFDICPMRYPSRIMLFVIIIVIIVVIIVVVYFNLGIFVKE